jgi:hypothetical protein
MNFYLEEYDAGASPSTLKGGQAWRTTHHPTYMEVDLDSQRRKHLFEF